MFYKTPVKSCSLGLPVVCFFVSAMLFHFVGGGLAWAERSGGVSVKALVEKDIVYQGEPFTFQIQLEGAESVPDSTQPDMRDLKDFAVESLGGQSNNRSSISIINGKMSKVESYGYTYSFRLIPRKTGKLVIPSVAVPLDSNGAKVLRTEPIAIQVTPPETSEEFQLEIKYAKTRFYVGEPVIMTVIWYLARDVQGVSFNLPVLEMDGFTIAEPKVDQDPGKQYIKIPLGQGSIPAEKGSKEYNGREYTTLTFRKVLIAREPGTFQVPESTVSCKALIGYSKPARSRNPHDSFFNEDLFRPGGREVYKTFIAGSEPIALTAVALPAEGRPDNFSGCIGTYKIEASGAPTDVSVGDPVTLNVSICGSEYLENVELPPLSQDPDLGKDFKIPDEMAAGVVKDGCKVFSQTLRAKSEEVKAIPPVRFCYFDPDPGEYRTVGSQPIPLRVKPTRIVTEADVEGRAVQKILKNELEAWSEGIAYNYEGPEVLESQTLALSSLVRSPPWMLALILPFVLYLALFIFVEVRRNQIADPDKLRYRKALATFIKRIEVLDRHPGDPASGSASVAAESYAGLLDALRQYLGDKLRVDGSALTFADAEKHLKDREADREIMHRLEEIFIFCEQGRYGGGCGINCAKPLDTLVEEVLDVVRRLDRDL